MRAFTLDTRHRTALSLSLVKSFMSRTATILTSFLVGLLTTLPLAAEDPPHIIALRKTLQEKQEGFVKVDVNTDKADTAFENVDFKGKTFVQDGKTYYAFRFTAPEQEGELVWSFRMPLGDCQWYIVPGEGEMNGFSQFFAKSLKEDVPGLGKKGDWFYLQFLDGENFMAGSDYIIWFHSPGDDRTTVPVSINFLPKEESRNTKEMYPMFR